jgi:hypothetical protein
VKKEKKNRKAKFLNDAEKYNNNNNKYFTKKEKKNKEKKPGRTQ